MNAAPPYRTRWTSLAALAMAAFYLLAAGRAMVPGMCATLRAVDGESSECSLNTGAYVRGIHACCVPPQGTPPRGSDPDSGDAPLPRETTCAFCKLVTTSYLLSDAPIMARLEPPIRDASNGDMHATPTAGPCWESPPGRAPPALV